MSGGKGNQDDTSEDLKEANHQFYFTGRIFLPFYHLINKPQEKGDYLTKTCSDLKLYYAVEMDWIFVWNEILRERDKEIKRQRDTIYLSV